MSEAKALHQEVIDEIGTQTLARFGLNIFSLNTYGAYDASVIASNNINTSYELNKNNKQGFGFTHESIDVGKRNIKSELYGNGEVSYTTDELAYINKEFNGGFKDTQNDKLKSILINQNYTPKEIADMSVKFPEFAKENHGLADVVTLDKNGNIIREEQHKVIQTTKGKNGLYGKNNKYIEDEKLRIVVANDDYKKHKNELIKTIKNSNNAKDVSAAKKALEKLDKSQTSRKESENGRTTAIKMQATQASSHIVQAGLSDAIVVALSTLANGAIWEIKDAFSDKGSDVGITVRIKRLLKKVLEEFNKTFKRGASFGAIDVGVGILSQIFKSIFSKLKSLWKTIRTSFKSIYNAIYSYITGEIKSYKELISTIIKGLLSAVMIVGTIALETKLEVFLAPIVSPIVASFLAPALSIVIGSIAVVVMSRSVDLALNTLFGVFAQRDRAKMKAEKVRKLYEELLPSLVEEREELKELIEKTYKKRKLSLNKSFNEFKQGLSNKDIDTLICGLSGINNMYGKKLQFETQKEFDGFMDSNCPLKL